MAQLLANRTAAEQWCGARFVPLAAMVAPMADAEEVQELGREGVGMVRAWLESTTWMRLPMNAYEDGHRCAVAYKGGRKKFDLAGNFLGDKKQRRNIWVECKRYKSEGLQHQEFKRFLTIAYAYTCKELEELGACDDEFLWVTSHPFFVSGWPHLVTEAKIKAAVADPAHADIIGDLTYDETIGRALAERIWLLVWSERQILKLSLTSAELAQVMGVIEREGEPLWKP